MNSNKNVAIYIRISTDREEQKTSLRNQKELCEEIIEQKNWDLYDIYVDMVSGLTPERPQFKRLLEDMEKGIIQYIVVKEGSRLARSVTTYEKIREISTKRNIHLLSVDGELDTFSKGYECITQIGADAQKESEKISKRVKNSIRMQAKRGEFTGSVAPYGYYIKYEEYLQNEDDTEPSIKRILSPREDGTVKIVQRIFRSYLNGKGAKSIAKELQDEGIPTPSMIAEKQNATARWNDTTIYGILDNEAYIGNLVQSVEETYFANEERKRKKKTEENIIRKDGAHTPIISDKIFKAVKSLKASKPKSGAKTQHHMFSNKLFCKDCGRRLIFKPNRGNGIYVCSTYKNKGVKYCANHSINEKKLIPLLSEELSKMNKLSFDLFSQKAEHKIKQLIGKQEQQLLALQYEIKNIENRVANLEGEIIDYKFSKIENASIEIARNEQLIKNQQKLLALKQVAITEIQTKIDLLKAPQTISTVRKKLMNTFQFKKFDLMTVNMFISKIDVNEDKTLEVHYRFSEANAS